MEQLPDSKKFKLGILYSFTLFICRFETEKNHPILKLKIFRSSYYIKRKNHSC